MHAQTAEMLTAMSEERYDTARQNLTLLAQKFGMEVGRDRSTPAALCPLMARYRSPGV